MIYHSHVSKAHFHKKAFALSLVLKVSFWNSGMAHYVVESALHVQSVASLISPIGF